MSSIAERLRAEREARGLTQTQVADAVGASKRTLQHWENGQSAPTAGDLACMALLGYDVRYVITGNRDYAPPPPLSAEEQVLLGHWRAASKATKNAALGALIGATVGAATRHVQQTIHGSVGHLTTGDAHITDGRMTVQDGRAGYAEKAKAPKKPG